MSKFLDMYQLPLMKDVRNSEHSSLIVSQIEETLQHKKFFLNDPMMSLQEAVKRFAWFEMLKNWEPFIGENPLPLPISASSSREAIRKHLRPKMKSALAKLSPRLIKHATDDSLHFPLAYMSDALVFMIENGWPIVRVLPKDLTQHKPSIGDFYLWNFEDQCYEPLATAFISHIASDLFMTVNDQRFMKLFHQEMLSSPVLKRVRTVQSLPVYCVGVENGIYNALTGTVIESDVLFVCTNRLSGSYRECPEQVWIDVPLSDGTTKTVTWESFLEDMARKDDGTVDQRRLFHLNQIIYQTLLGYNRSHTITFLKGVGGDGKSTLARVLTSVVRDENVAGISIEQFASGTKENTLFSLHGKSAIIHGEASSGLSITSGLSQLLKVLSGGDPVTVTPKYLSTVSFTFNGMMIQGSNDFPAFSDGLKEAERRRFDFILCENSYTAKNGKSTVDLGEKMSQPAWRDYIIWYTLSRHGLQGHFYSDLMSSDQQTVFRDISTKDTVPAFMTWLDDAGALEAREGSIITKRAILEIYKAFMAKDYADQFHRAAQNVDQVTKELLAAYGYVPPNHQEEALYGGPRVQASDHRSGGLALFLGTVSAQGAHYADVCLDIAGDDTPSLYYVFRPSARLNQVDMNVASVSPIEFFGLQRDFEVLFHEADCIAPELTREPIDIPEWSSSQIPDQKVPHTLTRCDVLMEENRRLASLLPGLQSDNMQEYLKSLHILGRYIDDGVVDPQHWNLTYPTDPRIVFDDVDYSERDHMRPEVAFQVIYVMNQNALEMIQLRQRPLN